MYTTIAGHTSDGRKPCPKPNPNPHCSGDCNHCPDCEAKVVNTKIEMPEVNHVDNDSENVKQKLQTDLRMIQKELTAMQEDLKVTLSLLGAIIANLFN